MKESNSYLSFRIDKEYYAAHVSYVHNIIEMVKITKVPHAPDYFLGVINLRGQVLPVIDARIKLSIKNFENTNDTCILVMEIKKDKKMIMVGFLVDAVTEVLEISENEIKPPPKIGMTNIEDEIITGVYYVNDNFIMILDMNLLLSKDQKVILESITKSVEVEKETV